MKPFPEIMDLAKDLGTDAEERLEKLYDALVKIGFDDSAIEAFIELFYEINALQKFSDEKTANANDLDILERRVRNHKHLPNGDCVEAF